MAYDISLSPRGRLQDAGRICCSGEGEVCCWDLTDMPPFFGGDASTCGSAMFFDADFNVAAIPEVGETITTVQQVVDSLKFQGYDFYVNAENPNVICLNNPSTLYPTFTFTDGNVVTSSTPFPTCTFDSITFTAPMNCS